MYALTHKEELERRGRKHGYGVSIRISKRTFSFISPFMFYNKEKLCKKNAFCKFFSINVYHKICCSDGKHDFELKHTRPNINIDDTLQ